MVFLLFPSVSWDHRHQWSLQEVFPFLFIILLSYATSLSFWLLFSFTYLFYLWFASIFGKESLYDSHTISLFFMKSIDFKKRGIWWESYNNLLNKYKLLTKISPHPVLDFPSFFCQVSFRALAKRTRKESTRLVFNLKDSYIFLFVLLHRWFSSFCEN